MPEEIDFIPGEAARYLAKAPSRADIRSLWVGLRVRSGEDATFALELALPREAADDYLLEAVSHCSDEHRHLCSYQRASSPLSVRAGPPR